MRLSHGVLILRRQPPRSESDVPRVRRVHGASRRHSWPIFRQKLRHSLSLTRGSLHPMSLWSSWQGCGCERSGARLVRKTAAQPGPFLHISSPICLKKLGRKAGPFWVPDSGPKIGTVFRPLIVILIEGRKTVPILGPESGTQNGSAFRPQQCQKMHPWIQKTGHPGPRKWATVLPWCGWPFRHANPKIRNTCSPLWSRPRPSQPEQDVHCSLSSRASQHQERSRKKYGRVQQGFQVDKVSKHGQIGQKTVSNGSLP